jgi:hemolysin activation/secretion protein
MLSPFSRLQRYCLYLTVFMQVFFRQASWSLLALLTASPTLAQTLPDAGSVLRDIERSTGKTEVAPAPLLPKPAPPAGVPLPEHAGQRIFVSAFRIQSSRFPEHELQAVVADYTNRELTLAELQAAARRISDYYRRRDYLAYAYLPPQTVRDGVVEIQVIEARFGRIKLDPATTTRLDPRLAMGLVTRRVPLGQTLRPGRLDQAVAILNELPGVRRAESLLEAGAQPGETDARLRIEDGPLAQGSLTANNTGSKGTGEWQGYLTGSLDNPFGRAEQIQFTGLGSEGSRYVRLAGSTLLGTSGLSGGVNASFMEYQVLESVSPLDLNGSAWTSGLSLNYPIRRGTGLSLTASAGLDYKRMLDRMEDAVLDDKRIAVGYLGLSLQSQDAWLGGGVNQLALTVNLGHLDLSANPDHRAADRLTAETHGGYGKFRVSLSREQPVSRRVSVLGQLQAQWSPLNLDSSEKFFLGGFYGVRAYPSGEASGDSGWLGNLEVRWQPADSLRFSGFYDLGWIRRHADPWIGWQTVARQPNDYSLQGAGVSLDWTPSSHVQTRAVLAYAIGDNPGSDAEGNDSDGSDQNLRAWVQMNISF